MANLNYYYFWSTIPPNKPKFFSFYRASRLKGWAVHTSSTAQTELLLIMEYTTYMITLVHNHHWMSLLESWNWGFFLSPWMLKIFEEDIWFRRPNWEIVSLVPVSLPAGRIPCLGLQQLGHLTLASSNWDTLPWPLAVGTPYLGL